MERNAVKAITTLLTIMLVLCAPSCLTYGTEQEDEEKPTVIVVIGATGTEEYAAQFASQARFWQQACLKGNAKFIAIGLDKAENSPDRMILQKTI